MATVSYQFKTGYYGLRVHETLEQVLSGKEGKGMRLPMPDRSAIIEAMSLTRASLEDAAKKYNSHERAILNYRDAGGNLPEHAAGDGPSAAGQDETFERIERHHEAMQEQAAFEEAKKTLKQQNEQQTRTARAQHLFEVHKVKGMDPMVEAHHEELDDAGVGHYMPQVVTAPPRRTWKAPPPQWVQAGYAQAPQFPSFEALNLGEIHVRQARPLTEAQNMT